MSFSQKQQHTISVAMQSNKCEQTDFGCPDYYMNNFLSGSEDSMREMMEYQFSGTDNMLALSGFSEVQMKALYCDSDSTKTNLHVDNSCIYASMGPAAPFNLSEVKQEHASSIELAGLPFFCPYESAGNLRHDTYVQSSHWLPKEETVSMEPYMNMEWQHIENHAFPVHNVKLEEVDEFSYNLRGKTVASDEISKKAYRKSRPRSKTAEFEHKRRSLITEKILALESLLPSLSKAKRNDQECIVEKAVAHVKYLQLQLKELSRSKLGKESVSAPLSSVEGYGHFHPDAQMLKEPLEEVFGNLLEQDEAVALKLLERRGLYLMPQNCLDGLRSAE